MLVLNRNWMPISVTTVEDAIGHIYTDGATIVDHETYIKYSWDDWAERGVRSDRPYIPGANGFKFECPEVIVLSHYGDVPQHTVHYSKYAVLKRDKHCCAYCGKQFYDSKLTIDHVVPRSQGGRTTWENCVAACKECNHKKADRTPEQAGMKLHVVPRKPAWVLNHRIDDMLERKPEWKPFVMV